MSPRAWVRAAAGATIVLSVALCFGQKKGERPGGPDPEEIDLDNPYGSGERPKGGGKEEDIADEKDEKPSRDEKRQSEPAEEAARKPSADPALDEPPPKAVRESKETKLSPLNPEPREFPRGPAEPSPAELDRLLADIATLRGRVAALTTALFSSKLRVRVHAEGDDARIDSFVVTLDDGVVFRAPERFVGQPERPIYEHAVAPGSHVVGVEIERHDARKSAFKTWQSTKFAIVVPENELLEVDVVLTDDSDMAEDFTDDQDGEYELEVEIRARVVD